MSAGLGQVEHDAGGRVCVHRVVRVTARVVEFVTLCEGRIAFGAPATTVALRDQFRRKLVTFVTDNGEVKPRYVTAEQIARRTETPAQRAARAARSRHSSAVKFELRVMEECTGSAGAKFSTVERKRFEAQAKAIADGIRRDGAHKHRNASNELLRSIYQLRIQRESEWFGRASSARYQRTERAERAERTARKGDESPWFVAELALPSWPCSRAEVKSAFAAIALRTHPDHGGTDAAFIKAKSARDAALTALEGRAA